jgi:hypothetical protein
VPSNGAVQMRQSATPSRHTGMDAEAMIRRLY